MTNFIYNMQDELFHLNMILPVGEFSPIVKLVDHIEAQGKQLRELNAAITKKNATIEKYEREKKELQNSNNYLGKKVNELNQGIRNSEDLTWKQKYDALLQSSEQAIGALQKKCQEYKNSESDATANTIETFTKTNKELEKKNKSLEHDYNELIKQRNTLYYENKKLERANLDLGDTIGLYVEEFKKLKDYISELEAKVKDLEAANEKFLVQDRVRNGVISLSSELNTKIDNQSKEITRLLKNQETLKAEMANKEQIISSLDATINHKNKMLDEYMTKCNNLEHNYKEEVRMKEQFKTTCFRHERTIESQNSTIKYLKGKVSDYVRLNAVLKGKLVSIGELANKIDDVILSEE